MPMRPREERGLINHERRLDELEEDVLRLKQSLPGLYQGNSGGGGGPSRIGYASGTITARSGGTLGAGSVEIYDPSSGALVSTGVTVAVYSLDDVDIDSGMLCSVTNINGVDLVMRLECGS